MELHSDLLAYGVYVCVPAQRPNCYFMFAAVYLVIAVVVMQKGIWKPKAFVQLHYLIVALPSFIYKTMKTVLNVQILLMQMHVPCDGNILSVPLL